MVALANGFADRGHRVDLVLVEAKGRYLPEVSHRVNIVDLRQRRVLASVGPLSRYLRRERPDAMLSALTHANFVAIISRTLARVGTRLVVSERNSLVPLQGLSGALLRFLIRVLYPRADSIIAVSRGIARELEDEIGRLSQRICSIPNPVEVDRIASLASEPAPHPWLVEGEPPTILAVGRLEPQKDYPTLLAAFARVRAQRDVRLIILGEGSLKEELEQLIIDENLTENVFLAGFHSNPFVWMAASQVYVLCSRHEGFPNSLVQAMACNTRVVSTACPTGPDEILEDGKWGILVPVARDDLLGDGILAALDSPDWPETDKRIAAYSSEVIVPLYLDQLMPSGR